MPLHPPYRDRDEWKDIVPIELNEDPSLVPVTINYTDEFKECMGYFRAIQQREEYHTSRAFELTGDLIQLNPANYTAWQYRRLCLLASSSSSGSSNALSSSTPTIPSSIDLTNELTFIQTIADRFGAKNYQLWAHRREIIRWLYEQGKTTTNVPSESGSSSSTPPGTSSLTFPTWKDNLLRQELNFTVRYLMQDIKNYHVWGQRQWLLSLFVFDITDGNGTDAPLPSSISTIIENEFDFTENLLLGNDDSDIRNNSAWNHRWFIFTRGIHYPMVELPLPSSTSGSTSTSTSSSSTGSYHSLPYVSLTRIEKEIQFVLTCLNIVQKNEAAWSYLRGLVRLPFRSETSPSVVVVSEGTGTTYPFPSLHRWITIVKFCQKCQNYSHPGINIFANEWLAEVAEEELIIYHRFQRTVSGTPTVASSLSSEFPYPFFYTNIDDAYKSIIQLYTLNSEHDIVRKKYWLHRIQKSTQLLL